MDTPSAGNARVEAAYLLGIYYLDKRDFQLAETVLQQGLRFNPESLPCLTTLGTLYSTRRDYEQASDMYERAYDVDSEDPLARKGKALSLIFRNNEEGFQLLNQVVQTKDMADETTGELMLFAIDRLEDNKFEESRKVFETAFRFVHHFGLEEDDPSRFTNDYNAYVGVLRATGRHQEALRVM